MTPSPVTQGQANSAAHFYHIDQTVLAGADGTAQTGVDFGAIDTLALAEVERLSAVSVK